MDYDTIYLDSLVAQTMEKWIHSHGGKMHTLRYTAYRKDGIMGNFTFDGDEEQFCVILTHAYPVGATFQPIVSQGRTYSCVRGVHSLNNGVPFETFEIIGVEGHSGLLFHAGNFNKDSHGCILLGEKFADYGSDEMITNSRDTFEKFMKRLEGINEFTLLVQ